MKQKEDNPKIFNKRLNLEAAMSNGVRPAPKIGSSGGGGDISERNYIGTVPLNLLRLSLPYAFSFMVKHNLITRFSNRSITNFLKNTKY